MDATVFDRLKEILDKATITYRVVEHIPTTTSEQSAHARNEPLEVGAKALLLKADKEFVLLVLPANCKLDSVSVKRKLNIKSLRFATSQELADLTGLEPGSVPPFGQPLFPFPLYADGSVGKQFGRVAFNAGSLTKSMVLNAEDWLKAANPVQFDLCHPFDGKPET